MPANQTEEHSDKGGASRNLWMRGLIMVGFIIAFGIGQTIMHFIAVVQFVFLVFNKRPNETLAEFGGSLARWLHAVAAYQCMGTDEKPFPWQPWPDAPANQSTDESA